MAIDTVKDVVSFDHMNALNSLNRIGLTQHLIPGWPGSFPTLTSRRSLTKRTRLSGKALSIRQEIFVGSSRFNQKSSRG